MVHDDFDELSVGFITTRASNFFLLNGALVFL